MGGIEQTRKSESWRYPLFLCPFLVRAKSVQYVPERNLRPDRHESYLSACASPDGPDPTLKQTPSSRPHNLGAKGLLKPLLINGHHKPGQE